MSKKKKSATPRTVNISILESALQRYQPLLSISEYGQLVAELQKPLTPAIRINTLKNDPIRMVESLRAMYGWEMEPVPFCPAGFRVHPNQNSISTTIEHRMGSYYIQDSASMLPAELFDFSGSEQPIILDLAASPGGKTTHLIDLSGDKGLVVANDSSRTRLKALQTVLQKWGTLNQAVTCYPGERFGDWFPEIFDLVLLDAPCSMQGLRSSESHPIRPITDHERQRLVQRQQLLLKSALKSTRVGGQVVYATCTLAPEEDEGVIAALLQQYPKTFEVTDICKKLPLSAPGLTSYNSIPYPQELSNTLRLWPHLLHTAGFFSARLTKTTSFHETSKPYPQFDLHQAGFNRVNSKKYQEFVTIIQSVYGFNLDKLINELNLSLWSRDTDLYLLPESLINNFPSLRLTSLGMLIGKVTGNEFLPSHEFVARFGQEFESGKIMLENEFLCAWLRGEDIRGYSIKQPASARIVVVMDQIGRNLGRGKILANQLKNLLPNRIF